MSCVGMVLYLYSNIMVMAAQLRIEWWSAPAEDDYADRTTLPKSTRPDFAVYLPWES